MMDEDRRDIKILGDSTVSGGFFKDLHITGDVTMNGSVDCISLKILGDCAVNDSLKTKAGTITGDLAVRNDLIAQSLKIRGDLSIGRNAVITDVQFLGDVRIDGDLSSEQIDIKGDLEVKGNCNSEIFKSKGDLKIDGLLNADEINIELYGNSKIREIGGDKISVRHGSKSLFKKLATSVFNGNHIGNLTTDTVEGDEIYLEYTTAKVVRGNDVITGPGCRIELLEYKNKFSQSDGAIVKENKKIV